MFDHRMMLVLCPLLPLLAAVFTAACGARWLRQNAHWPTIFCLGLAFLSALGLSLHLLNEEQRPKVAVGVEETVSICNWVQIPDAYAYSYSGSDHAKSSTAGEHVGQVTAGAQDATERSMTRIPFQVDITLRLDPLTAVMLVTVNFVALLVAIFAVEYMHGDRGYWRFFSYVSLFVFCMNLLVTASNFLLLFACWEGVGVCSYLLIGFWYDRPAAAAAGKKAFLVNRVGDFGFTLAMLLIWISYGTLNFHDVTGDAGTIPGVLGQTRLTADAFVGGGIGLAICLLLLLGACGKSAQLPLHVWLADAMEGPTPVSALIHAATMVTAGVYMVARCTPLFVAAPVAQLVVACVGGLTALMAAIIALSQFDLKRVLAYSTISQLGYMFLALGAGTWAGITAGIFHLFTHAFFKALLFLGAGSVMHAMGNVIDIRRFGGLRSVMPWTYRTFLVGCLALAGLAPLSGFWSKDAILGAVHDQSLAMQAAASGSSDHAAGHATNLAHLHGRDAEELRRGAIIYTALYYLGLATALLTAIYTFRAFFLTFFGPRKIPPEAGHHAHESPWVMLIPLMILALFAAFAGWVGHAGHRFADFLQETPSLAMTAIRHSPSPHVFHPEVALWSSVVAVTGIAIAAFLYLGSTREAAWLSRWFSRPWMGYLYPLSQHKFYVDEIYDTCLVRPLRSLAQVLYRGDQKLIDGLVDLVGSLPARLGAILRRCQGGLLSRYALAMAFAVIVLESLRIWWGN